MATTIFSKLIKKLKPTKKIHREPPNRQLDKLSLKLSVNLELIKEAMGNSMDLIIKEFLVGKTRAAIICLDGLVAKDVIDKHILKTMMYHTRLTNPTPVTDKDEFITLIRECTITITEIKEVETIDETLSEILLGKTALLFNGFAFAAALDTIGFESRGVQEPQTEAVVRGPREGFTEKLATNVSLIRRKIKSPDLRIEKMTLGRVSNTDICIVYIDSIANPKIIEEVKKRLRRIDIDAIMESGYIEELIEDAPFSVFPTVGNTEKPDIAAAKLLEGRVVIITEGTPFVLTMPYLFIESLQVSEDYYSRFLSATLIRFIRIGALITTTILPALYVGLTSFHPEMIPTVLLITMAASKEGIPFSALTEILIMGLMFEALREAGVRLPKPVGQAVSIVGALIIGEATVTAGIVSAPAVIVTALTGITSFIIPPLASTTIYIRMYYVLLTGFLGFYGLSLGMVIILIHMVSLRSCGVPYLSPLAPSTFSDLKDFIFRAPLWAMKSRPRVIGWKNPIRMREGNRPKPPSNAEKELIYRYNKRGPS